MENFTQDDLEEFLQEHLQNHRMYPKDAIWRNIHTKLHGDKRWPALTIAAILLVSVTTFICLHFSSSQNIFSIKPALEPNKSLATAQNPQAINNKNFSLSANDNTTGNYTPITAGDVPGSEAPTANKHNALSANETPAAQNDIEDSNDDDAINTDQSNTIENKQQVLLMQPVEPENEAGTVSRQIHTPFGSPQADLSSSQRLPLVISQNNIAPNEVKTSSPSVNKEANTSLIEKYKQSHGPGKFSMLVYAAPSISYRKLVEDHAAIKNANEEAARIRNTPASVNIINNGSDVNDAVRHKPSSGIEAGVSILYDFTRTIRLKGGLQFNMRQYTIDAYKSNTELSSIALVDNDRVDTINTLSLYRNYNGNSSAELVNRYYQVSVPLGIEWQVAGNNRFQFNIAGSIQPTYLLNRNAYMLTTNFKNYADEELVRKWNINSNIEAFVTMNIGDFKWQLGPQIRYQPYSSFIKEYPIKEHLIDYGIKLGFSTRIK